MTIPVRLQLSRKRGFSLQSWSREVNGLAAVKVDRSTIFGNPFPLDVYGREGAIDLFRRWLTGNMSAHERSGLSREDRWSAGECPVSLGTVARWLCDDLQKLKGRNLACWCAIYTSCLAAIVLLELANEATGPRGAPAMPSQTPECASHKMTSPEECKCRRCWTERSASMTLLDQLSRVMILCPTCGNKRCPHATDHRLTCTNSNEPGQPWKLLRRRLGPGRDDQRGMGSQASR